MRGRESSGFGRNMSLSRLRSVWNAGGGREVGDTLGRRSDEEEEEESAVSRGELRGDGEEVEGGLGAKDGRAAVVSGEEDLETGDLEDEEEEEEVVLEDAVMLPRWWRR